MTLEAALTDTKETIARLTDQLNAADEAGRQYIRDRLDRMTAEVDMPDDAYDTCRREAREALGDLRQIEKAMRKRERDYAFSVDEMETRLNEIDAYRRQKRKARLGQRKLKLLTPAPTNGQIDLMEQRGTHFAQGVTVWKLLLLLFAGSLLGVLMEDAWCVVVHGRFESRAGLVYGPFNLLYGFGAVFLSATLYRIRNLNKLYAFAGGFVAGTAVEFSCSWLQEKLFGATSWDYSHLPFNIQGRVCLLYSIFWGVLGVLWIKDIYPRISWLILKIPNRAGKILTVALTVFLAVDGLITAGAVVRWHERNNGDPPVTALGALFDERFPDERLKGVFAGWNFVTDERIIPEDDMWYRLFNEEREGADVSDRS